MKLCEKESVGIRKSRLAAAVLGMLILFGLGSCRNHRERLIEDFSGHRFEQLDHAQTVENYDEYSEALYFASAYDIAPADADSLAKTLPEFAEASYFARSEMVPLLRPGQLYQYRMHADGREVSALLLDRDHLRVIFYHSRAGR